MKRKIETSAAAFTKLRPISQRQMQKFINLKSEELANVRSCKRFKFSKKLTINLANLATSYAEKLLSVAGTIARERHSKDGVLLLDGTEINTEDVEKSSKYVLTPYLSDRLVSRRKVINYFLYDTTEHANDDIENNGKSKDVNEYLLVENDGCNLNYF